MIPAPSFGHILVSILEIPLSHSAGISVPGAGCRASVVARRGGGKQPLHEKDSSANILPMEVAADTGLLNLDFAGPETLGRPDDGVVTRLIEVRHVMSIEPDFGREELGIQDCVFGARVSVQPGKVAICERSKIVDSLRGLGGLKRIRNYVLRRSERRGRRGYGRLPRLCRGKWKRAGNRGGGGYQRAILRSPVGSRFRGSRILRFYRGKTRFQPFNSLQQLLFSVGQGR